MGNSEFSRGLLQIEIEKLNLGRDYKPIYKTMYQLKDIRNQGEGLKVLQFATKEEIVADLVGYHSQDFKGDILEAMKTDKCDTMELKLAWLCAYGGWEVLKL